MADKTGSCLCGAVAFEITGLLRSVIACHCHQCRKQTGTYMSSTAVKNEQFRLTKTRGLKWYRSSDTGRRGFCEQCGSVLFWKGDGYDYIAIAAGSIDGKLGVTLEGHIFCDSAGDYYQITGGRFQAPGLHKEPQTSWRQLNFRSWHSSISFCKCADFPLLGVVSPLHLGPSEANS
jgi:hypothetical protein